MKTRHFLIISCLFCSGLGLAQNKLFEKYADMDNVTSVYISKTMFQMIPKVENIGVNLMNMTGKIESLQLVSTERQDMITQMKKEFSQLVTTRHEEMMRVKDGKTRVSFYTDLKNDKIKELILLVEAEDNYTAILLTGNFTLKDIQDIADQY